MNKRIILSILAVVVCLPAAEAVAAKKKARLSGWTQSYKSGYKDVNGAWAGGSEIMHALGHQDFRTTLKYLHRSHDDGLRVSAHVADRIARAMAASGGN